MPKSLDDFIVHGAGDMLCFHCDKKFGPTSPASLDWPYLIVQCRECGCMTPFTVEPYRTKKQTRTRAVK
jgi:hypothetical protein